MAYLEEVAKWEEGIYQIEETDPVQGGPNGIDNLPNKQLANRTLWLKEQAESLGERVSDIEGKVAGLDIPDVEELLDRQNAAALWATRYANYSIEHGYLELVHKGYTIADDVRVNVILGVAGDDSLDVEDTSLLVPGRSYTLIEGETKETVTVDKVLSPTRVRLSTMLDNNYETGAVLARTSAEIDYDSHVIFGAGEYYSLPFSFQGSGRVIIRQIAGNEPVVEISPANTEIYSELALLSSTTGDGITERVYSIDAGGDVNLRVTLGDGDILEGIAVFRDAVVTGVAAKMQIDAVYGDPVASPAQTDVGGMPVVSFSADQDQTISFNRVWEVKSDVAIEIGYLMSSDDSGDVKIRISYAVNGGSYTDMDQTITPGSGTTFKKAVLDAKIPSTAFAAGDNLLTVKLSRLGADVADTHPGAFQLASLRLLQEG